jgi:hypothetical protein
MLDSSINMQKGKKRKRRFFCFVEIFVFGSLLFFVLTF